MASRVQVAKFPSALHDFKDLERTRTKPSSTREWNMDEDDVIDHLYEDSFNTRVEILEQLLLTVKRNGGRLPYTDQLSIFQGLAQALSAEHWEIRLKCIQLIHEIIPNFGENLDTCMGVVMKKLLPNIGDMKISVRKAVIQTLHVYMKNVNNVNVFLHNIVQIGLESDNSKVRRETINALPVLLTKEFSNTDLYDVTHSLAKKLIDSSVEDNLRDPSLFTMKKIEELVGEHEFNTYLQRLSAPIRRYYFQLTDRQENMLSANNQEYLYSTPSSSRDKHTGSGFMYSDEMEMNGYGQHTSHPMAVSSAIYNDSYEFGIIPSHVMNHINDQDNFRVRSQAVEELKEIIARLTSMDVAQTLIPNMIAFISFLNNLLDDTNFKITTVTLEILCLLVERLGSNVKLFLKPLVLAMAKRMGDTKIVVRQAVMKVAMKMMQSYSARPVLSVISENLHHRNSRVRQETINIVIAALMTFPSYDFILPDICEIVGPSLTDPKRQVRQAALECFAALAQAMGAGRLQPLVQAVDNVELNTEREGEGLMGAVQARLARRQLPRLNSEGLVEYATPIPSSATHRPVSTPSQGADMDWILAVGSGNGSARSSRTETIEMESVVSSARSTPQTSDQKPNARRFMSAGKGRNKLPWDEEFDNNKRMYDSINLPTSSHVKEDPGPPRSKVMWTSDTESSPDLRRVPKRRQTVVGIKPTDETDNGGSYKQIHQSRIKRQQLINNRPTQLEILDSNSPLTRNVRENGNVRSDYKSPRPFLDPITVDNLPSNNDENKQDVDESPIHLRPTLARNSATRRVSPKVPPTYQPERYAGSDTQREDDVDSAYAASLEGTIECDQDQEFNSSLKKIRNSASKKKAEKKEELQKQSSQQSLNSSLSDTLEFESGVYSSRTDLNGFKKGRKADSPFEAKPKLVRSGVFNKRNSSDSLDDVDYRNGSFSNHMDYNPNSGVTIPTNRNSDVQIVGKGYSDDSGSETKVSPTHRVKERRRFKGTLISPLGMASMHYTGAVDLDDNTIPGRQKITLVGKGVFDSSVNGTDLTSSSSQISPDNRPIRGEGKAAPKGVYGVGVKNSTSDSNSYSSINSLSDEETLLDDSQVMTKSIKERIDQTKRLRQEELEQKRTEKEREEKIKRERERQQEKLRQLSSDDNFGIETLSINGSSSQSTPTKTSPPKAPPPAVTPRKKIKTTSEPVSSQPMSAQSNTPLDLENPEDWKPLRDPDAGLKDGLKKLSHDDWEIKNDGISIIRRICWHHPEVILAQLHTVCVAVNAEVKNLRSQVSRMAIVCLGEMFTNLKKGMDPDLDSTTRTLLAKNAESNTFIKNDVEKALGAMVDNVSPPRALLALILGGSEHKSSSVRKMTAQFLVEIAEKLGPGRILSGIKDMTDKVLPTAAKLMQDGSPETRYYGRQIFFMLMSHQDFDKMLNKHVNATTIRNIQENLDNLKQKGLGEMPNEPASAKSRRSGHGSRSNSSVRSNSAGSSGDVLTTPQPKRKVVKTDASTMEEINEMINMMSASNWQDRLKALVDFLEMCEVNPDNITSHIVKIFDKFSPRLVDSNSKVNLFALQVLYQIVPTLKEGLTQGPLLNIAVGNIVPNLSSKNKEIHQTAKQILETLIEHIDSCFLIEPFANQAISAGPRSKPEVVEKVAYLVQKVYSKKSKQVIILRVLPLMWHLLGATNSSGAVHGGSSDIRSASSQLANVLHSLMGQTFMDKAQHNLTPRNVELLKDLLER